MNSRLPAVAGGFYPGEAGKLQATVDALLADAQKRKPAPASASKALIAPHAGYVYSGAVAASAYHRVLPMKGKVQRVILLGPAHRVAFRGFALPSVDAFDTPLGPVRLDRPVIDRLVEVRDDCAIRDDAHAQEHSLEVHLPFLQRTLGDVALVPVVVGDANPDTVAHLLSQLWGGPETLVVVSTDLSHYHAYDEAQKIDGDTVMKIGALQAGTFGSKQACGSRPVNGMLKLANHLGLRITELDVRNSGDTAGPKDRVVGYASWVLEPADTARFADPFRSQMIDVAAKAIAIRLTRQKRPEINLNTFPHELRTVAASFVTINLKRRLRGCIGSLKAHRPLAADLAWNAVSAGFEDPRFNQLTVQEFRAAELEISILSNPAPFSFNDQEDLLSKLRPHRDGLILESRGKRGTFLPKVWDGLDTPEKFLNGLKVKAGLPRDHWADDVKIWRYTTETFGAPVPENLFRKAA